MSWYAVMVTHGYVDDVDLYVFDTRSERDRFLEHGARYSYSLVVPWETRPVRASEAKLLANVDDFGDRYACLYGGGVRYVWGQAGYERWCREHDERSAA